MGPGIEGPRPSVDEALSRLIEGNQRFVRGAARREPFRTETLAALSSAQRPYATVLGCSDSRVPPEWVFDAGVGELFVIRVGDWGGYMMLDCDDPTAIHKFCSMLPAFVFEARPVIPIEDAVRVELESIAFRDGLKAK